MIKHEEVRKKLLFSPLKINNGLIVGDLFKFISDYIAQQEKKDELLGLYREAYVYIMNGKLDDQIIALEEELK